MTLSLPDRSNIQSVISKHVEPFLKQVAKVPNQSTSADFKAPEYAFTTSYIVGKRFSTGGYPSYDAAASLAKNPLFAALAGKAKKLRAAPDKAVRLVIACDGGCGPFRPATPPRHYSAHAIASGFLRQRHSIDLVLLATANEIGRGPVSGDRVFAMRYNLVVGPRSSRHDRLNDKTLTAIERTLYEALSAVPQPAQTINSAAVRARENGVGPDMMGGYRMPAANRIRVSARAVQRLLAGQITREEFAEAHGWDGDQRSENPFSFRLARGEMIKATKVESAGDRDDDWLEFQFAKDAAVAKFDLGR